MDGSGFHSLYSLYPRASPSPHILRVRQLPQIQYKKSYIQQTRKQGCQANPRQAKTTRNTHLTYSEICSVSSTFEKQQYIYDIEERQSPIIVRQQKMYA